MIRNDRRRLLVGAGLGLLAGAASLAGARAAPGQTAKAPFSPAAGPRSRTIFVNDLSGDVDGLFAAVHQILSPSTELRAIVGSGTGSAGETAERSTALATEILELMGKPGRVAVHQGAAAKIKTPGVPVRSPGAQAIIDEALRSDTTLPLYIGVGGGLTEVASALMIEPRIAERFTLVWIGGDAYPGGGTGETNFNIDRLAAQFIFNETKVRIWQVPRSVYATCLVSATELQAFVAPCGAIGEWLYRKVVEAPAKYRNLLNMGETWTLGDNPVVLLTALTDWSPGTAASRPFKFERTGSSASQTVAAPRLNPDGTFTPRPDGRAIRIFESVDTRMMMNDLFAKLRVNYGG